MNNKLVIFVLMLILGGGGLTAPAEGQAAESASFLLYDEFPNYAERAEQASTNFLLNEGGLTWVALPVASTNFQIVSGPPAVPSSSSSSSSVSTSSVSSEASPPQGGGRRGGEGEPHPSAPPEPGGTSSRSSTQSIPSSAPFEPSPRQADHLPQVPALYPRADHGTAASATASQSSQGSDQIVEQETPSPRSLDAYFYGDNCQLTDSPVRNAASPAQEVVCVYRLYLVKMPNISLLGTWKGVEIILHLMDILLIILGFLLILLAGMFHKRQLSRKQQRPAHRRRKHSSRVSHRK